MFLTRKTNRVARWASGLMLAIALAGLMAACGDPTATPAPAATTAASTTAASATTAAAATTAATGATTAAASAGMQKVNFALDWVIYGRHAGFFVALEKGYYKEQGLDVTISRGYGSADSIKKVAAGTIDIAFGDVGSLVVTRANENTAVKAIDMIYGRAPHTIYFLESSNIKTPKDLEGKTIAAPAGDAIRTVFPAFAAANNIDVSKVNWATIDATAKTAVLLGGQSDAITEFTMAAPQLQKQAGDSKKVKSFVFSDYGLQFYSNAVIATDDMIKTKPDLLKKFVAATNKGMTDAFANPDEAVTLLRKTHPEVEADIAKAEIMAVKELAMTDEAKKNGLGFMDPEKMKATRDLMAKYFTLKSAIEPEALYTNDMLKK